MACAVWHPNGERLLTVSELPRVVVGNANHPGGTLPSHQHPSRVAARQRAWQQSAARRVLMAIEHAGPVTWADLAPALDMTTKLIRHALTHLRDRGLARIVVRSKGSQMSVYEITPAGRARLQEDRGAAGEPRATPTLVAWPEADQ
jgi:hypothetical protein